jgi:hypothetical protein
VTGMSLNALVMAFRALKQVRPECRRVTLADALSGAVLPEMQLASGCIGWEVLDEDVLQ